MNAFMIRNECSCGFTFTSYQDPRSRSALYIYQNQSTIYITLIYDLVSPLCSLMLRRGETQSGLKSDKPRTKDGKMWIAVFLGI